MNKRELRELLSRVAELGGDDNLCAKIINGALAGQSRQTLDRAIDQAVLMGENSGQHNTGQSIEERVTSFKQIDDEVFWGAFGLASRMADPI